MRSRTLVALFGDETTSRRDMDDAAVDRYPEAQASRRELHVASPDPHAARGEVRGGSQGLLAGSGRESSRLVARTADRDYCDGWRDGHRSGPWYAATSLIDAPSSCAALWIESVYA